MSELSQWFETRKRAGGASDESFVTLKDETPDWLQAAVRDAHKGDLPNDWVFAECEAACNAIDDDSLSSDDTHDYTDGRVDIYTKDLFCWATDMCLSRTWSDAEEEANQLGNSGTVSEHIGAVQFCAIRYIAEVMVHAYEKNKEEE